MRFVTTCQSILKTSSHLNWENSAANSTATSEHGLNHIHERFLLRPRPKRTPLGPKQAEQLCRKAIATIPDCKPKHILRQEADASRPCPIAPEGCSPASFPTRQTQQQPKPLYTRRIHPMQANIACGSKAAGQNAGNARNARARPPSANQLAAKRRKSPNQTVGLRHTTLSRRSSQNA